MDGPSRSDHSILIRIYSLWRLEIIAVMVSLYPHHQSVASLSLPYLVKLTSDRKTWPPFINFLLPFRGTMHGQSFPIQGALLPSQCVPNDTDHFVIAYFHHHGNPSTTPSSFFTEKRGTLIQQRLRDPFANTSPNANSSLDPSLLPLVPDQSVYYL